MKPRLPRTALQDAIYAQRAFDCDDYNLSGLLRTSIRRVDGSLLRDLRSPEFHFRYRELVRARVTARRWLAKAKLTAIADKRPTRKLMLVRA